MTQTLKHYIDITLLPSDDIGVHFLWGKVMMQVHLALVEIKDTNNKTPIAVSFPECKSATAKHAAFMGNKVRLFAACLSDFDKLNIQKWLIRLEDYVHIKAVKEVPDEIEGFESFNRITKAGRPDKLIRRRMKRKGETIEQATSHFSSYSMDKTIKALPFIKMKSLSDKGDFNLAIKRTAMSERNREIAFSTYGFNKEAALPKF